jgi:hypothetical protein
MPVYSVELGGHQWGGRNDMMRVIVALRSSAIFRAGGEEKLLVLLTCQNPISMVQI